MNGMVTHDWGALGMIAMTEIIGLIGLATSRNTSSWYITSWIDLKLERFATIAVV